MHVQVRGVASLKSARSLGSLLRYVLFRRGWLTSSIMEAAAFVRGQPDLKAPDLELGIAPVIYMDEGLTPPKQHGMSIGTVLLRPLSVGAIELQSSDPSTPPSIDPRYLSDPSGDDLQTMIRGLRMLRRICQAQALAPYCDGELAPGDGCQSNDDLAGFIRATAHTIYHPVGTCKMGMDDMAVVDPSLRVRGVMGLRVADASIMPTLVRGHTNAASIMIGERAAELVVSGL
jgi:choline dehydrogenase